ncbi:hypothetical protein BKA93DRAFT_219290 [Sparassis latifolia]
MRAMGFGAVQSRGSQDARRCCVYPGCLVVIDVQLPELIVSQALSSITVCLSYVDENQVASSQPTCNGSYNIRRMQVLVHKPQRRPSSKHLEIVEWHSWCTSRRRIIQNDSGTPTLRCVQGVLTYSTARWEASLLVCSRRGASEDEDLVENVGDD